MSWELDFTLKTRCPCGKGYLEQKQFSDDWNRIRVDPIIINCNSCKKQYCIIEKSFPERKPKRGFTEEYYICKIDDPEPLVNGQIIILER